MDAPGPDPLCALTPGEVPGGHISPLFWQHGEDPALLREEMRAMRSVGIRQCIVESRSHPDWLGPGWWRSLDAILEEARALGMRVWVFDDATYPSGRAGTLMRDRHPDLLKVYLGRRQIEARGPLPGALFTVGAWIGEGERLVGVVAGRRTGPRTDELDPQTLADVTERVAGGELRWDVPEGDWRVFVLVRTRDGGEEWTRDYLNPLVPAATEAFIAEVHEAHRVRYGALFGTTFAGFFTDEPRFGNRPAYDAVLGAVDMVLPWSDDLLAELSEGWKEPFLRFLPALWHDAGEVAHRARFLFMDVVSARFGKNYSAAIGRWCRTHGVQFIGHVVEDNDAHARLGHGAGHFFRALQGQDMSGLDIVYQVWPGFPEGRISTPFGPWDLDFFRWGIGKMASSAAHADPRKAGLTMCEIFGAYGWQLGLRDMKWLTDFACVRGINFLVPHAFSPRFPDPDCPPHFYARGNNPQWRLFGHWAAHAERLCHLLSGGEHAAPVAVLYHAEAEWAGRCARSWDVVRVLAERQIDCDVTSIDALTDPLLTRVGAGSFTMNHETFQCLVVPFAERLPRRFLELALRLLRAGVPVVFAGGAPGAASDGDAPAGALDELRSHPLAAVIPVEHLAESLEKRGIARLSTRPAQPHLRTYRYRRRGVDLVFCVNEDTRATVDTRLFVDDTRRPVAYDSLTDAILPVDGTPEAGGVSLRLRLEPYGSLFVVFADGLPASAPAAGGAPVPFLADLTPVTTLEGPWLIGLAEASAWPAFSPRPDLTAAGDVSMAKGYGDFAGTISYEARIELPAGRGDLWLDLGLVGESSQAWLDGTALGTRICPPHRYALRRPGPGLHGLRLEITTTLAHRLGGNAFNRAMPQGPLGLVGPVRLLVGAV